MKQYVCLEGIEYGNRFFTMNDETRDASKLSDGTVVYKILGYADTCEEAQKIIYGPDYNQPEFKEQLFKKYLTENNFGNVFSQKDIENFSKLLSNMPG